MFWKQWFKPKNKSNNKVDEEREIYNKILEPYNSQSFNVIQIEEMKKLLVINSVTNPDNLDQCYDKLYFFRHYQFTEKNKEIDHEVFTIIAKIELIALSFEIFKPGHIEELIYHNPYILHFMENYNQYKSFFSMFIYNIILNKQQNKYGELLYPVFVFSYLLNMIMVYEKEQTKKNKNKENKDKEKDYLCLNKDYKKDNKDFIFYLGLLLPSIPKEQIEELTPVMRSFLSEILNKIMILKNKEDHPIKMFRIKNINYKTIYSLIAFPLTNEGQNLVFPSMVFSAYPMLEKQKFLGKENYHLSHYTNEVIECFKIDRIRHIVVDVYKSFHNHFELLVTNEDMMNQYDLVYKIHTEELKKNLDMMLIFEWLCNLHSHTGEEATTLIYLESKFNKTQTYHKSFHRLFQETYFNNAHLEKFPNIYLLSKISAKGDEIFDLRFKSNLIIDVTRIDKKYLQEDGFDSKVGETYDKAKIISYHHLVVIEKFLKDNPNYIKYKNHFMRYFDNDHYWRVFKDKDNNDEGLKPNSDLELVSYYDTSLINIKDNNIKTIIQGCKNYCNRPDFVNLSIICYGGSGNSKSTLGVYLSKILNKKLTTISGSSIVTKWVGESEKNVKDIFHTMDKNDLLLIEEADSLFVSRDNNHSQTWDISLTNEWLVQLERFKGVLIVTTNHIQNFDQAMLRRFTLKYEFLDLKPELYYKALKPHILKYKMENDMTQKEIKQKLSGLRLGDVGNVEKMIPFYKIKTVSQYVDYLQKEIALRNTESKKMGYLKV